jgi:hypothetical protein
MDFSPQIRGFGGDYPHFADLALGKVPGRTRDDQITFYHNIGNQGLQFSSVGVAVYRERPISLSVSFAPHKPSMRPTSLGVQPPRERHGARRPVRSAPSCRLQFRNPLPHSYLYVLGWFGITGCSNL